MRLLAALSSGLLLVVISAPANLHWMHWLSFLPLFWSLRPEQHRRNALLGYASGWIGLFFLFYWLIETVTRFSSLPWAVSFAVLVIFATAFAIPYAIVFGTVHWLRARLGRAWVFVTPSLLVAVEKLGPALFPYYQGVSQYRFPWTWQLASVFGVWSLSWLILFCNAVLAEALYSRAERRPQPYALFGTLAALLGLTLAFGAWRYSAVDAELASARTIRVALIQQNTTMEERLGQPRKIGFYEWIRQTTSLRDQRPDLVVWPEGSVPYNPTEPKVAELLGGLARSGGFDLLVGGGTTEPAPADSGRKYLHYNSCYLYDKQGEVAGRYDKMVPLPFGEYIPFADTFPFLNDIIEGPGDFRKGQTPTVFQADGYTFTAPICYEAILDSQMWKLATADLLVNITNDAWFGDTASPHQHAMLAAVQATHFGRPMLRIAYTGVCFVVEPHGRILYETVPFTESATVETLRLGRVDTVYMKGGWLFSYLAASFAAGGLALAWRRGRSASA